MPALAILQSLVLRASRLLGAAPPGLAGFYEALLDHSGDSAPIAKVIVIMLSW